MQSAVAFPVDHFDVRQLNDAQVVAQKHSGLVYIVWQRRCGKAVVAELAILADSPLPIWDCLVG